MGIVFELFVVAFIVLTDFIPPSSLSQSFQTSFIYESGFNFALVLALSYRIFFPHNLLSAMRKWLLDSLTS